MFDEFDEDNTCLLSLGEIYYVIENLDEMPLSLGKRLCVLKQDRFITFMLTIHEEGSKQRQQNKFFSSPPLKLWLWAKLPPISV